MIAQTRELFAALAAWAGQDVRVRVAWTGSGETLLHTKGRLGEPDAWQEGDELRGVWSLGTGQMTLGSFHLDEWRSAGDEGDDLLVLTLGDGLVRVTVALDLDED